MQDANILVLATPSNCQFFFTDEVIHCSNIEQLSIVVTKPILLSWSSLGLRLMNYCKHNNIMWKTHLKCSVHVEDNLKQNDICSIASTIRNKITVTQEAKVFTSLADKVTDCSNFEHLSVVLRSVDANKRIQEEFIDFNV